MAIPVKSELPSLALLIVSPNSASALTFARKIEASETLQAATVRFEVRETLFSALAEVLSGRVDILLIDSSVFGDVAWKGRGRSTELDFLTRASTLSSVGIAIYGPSTSKNTLVASLLVGADDYISDTEDSDVVGARIFALHRRVVRSSRRLRTEALTSSPAFHIAGWQIRPDSRVVRSISGSDVRLSRKEHDFLMGIVSDAVDDNHMRRQSGLDRNLAYRVRKKLGDDFPILAEDGVYRLTEAPLRLAPDTQ